MLITVAAALVAAGHRLRVTAQTAQTPHLLPLPEDLPNLAGGVYELQARSRVNVPLLP